MITVGQLFEAYSDCRRNKRNTPSALLFEQDLENNLIDLLDELRTGTWMPRPSRVFVVKHPKPREVWAAEFRDRIVHHALYNAVRHLFELSFLADSCASIPSRGTLYAADRLERHLRSCTENWTRKAFVLKADIASFFCSIRHADLIALLRRRIRDDFWLDIAEKLVRQDVKIGADIRCSWADLALIPERKSLFHAAPGVGLPIGNLSSQFFANVLLDPLDQMVRRKLGFRHYCRYVDDFALVHRDPKELLTAGAAIRAHLAGIGLKLAEDKTAVFPAEKGIDFVGSVIRPHHRSARPKTIRHAVQRVLNAPIDEMAVTVTSYLGLLRHVGSFQQRIEIARAGRKRGLKIDLELTRVTGRLKRVPVRKEP